MINSVLMVCTGNVCRSPMAEVLLASRLERRGLSVRVESAGLGALVGEPADVIARDLVRERGLNLEAHHARQVDCTLARSFELILVMESVQQRAVEALEPTARGRVHRIGRMRGFDVPDPYKRGRGAFEEAFALIERGLDELDRVFWSGRP